MEPSYKLHKILKTGPRGCTQASYARLEAIVKFDSEESPHCVYNEMVALRLAQTLHVPLADGALTMTPDGPAFASLRLDYIGLNLPDVLASQLDAVADTYPDAVAALVAFDLWIGNWDRAQNLKACLVSPHLRLFRAFDHSHALLNIEADPDKSIERLNPQELIVKFHPFYGKVQWEHLYQWVERIQFMPTDYLQECCCYGRDFRGVSTQRQGALAAALDRRREGLTDLLSVYGRQILGEERP